MGGLRLGLRIGRHRNRRCRRTCASQQQEGNQRKDDALHEVHGVLHS